jgi:predicted RNA-binding protein associated with RNAse of E/G family
VPGVIVRKLDPQGREQIRWSGTLVRQGDAEIVLEAAFSRPTQYLEYLVLAQGDRMVEHYYTDRWYSVYEIYSGSEGPFKGWYCNIVRPARWRGDTLETVDLALDLFVSTEGRTLELDWEEFQALSLPPAERDQALGALRELEDRVRMRQPPFHRLAQGEPRTENSSP